jgi:hypothetical protein
MGDLRPDNGGLPPDDGKPHGLPDLPPEWGTIVIPDDPAELAHEADALRREMRGSARRAKFRRMIGLGGQSSSLGIPVVIMTVAILTTLVSLLVVTWGNRPVGTVPPASNTHTSAPAPAGPDLKSPIPDLTFVTARGDQVRVGDVVPLVFLMVDGCDCQPLIDSVATAAPPGVRIVPITAGTPSHASPDPTNVLRLEDPAGTLRARFPTNASPDGTATAVVINGSGNVVAAIPHVKSAADIKPLNPGG